MVKEIFPILNNVGIGDQITIIIHYNVYSRLVACKKFIYSSLYVTA